MIELVKEKKILNRLIILILVTIPLFGLLGGTPFLTFNFRELSNFLPGIYFVAIITLLFWILNIGLLLLAEKVPFLKKIFLRAAISIVVGIALSTTIFHYFRLNNPPPFRIEAKDADGDKIISFGIGDKAKAFKFSLADSNFVPIERPVFRQQSNHFFFFPQIVRSLTINLIILTLCELVFLYFRKQKIESENARLKQFNLEAKNNQLKMQLHPHFLFNSLNTLRLLLKKDADKAEDYLLKLSEMLRFSTTSALHDMVDVEDELKLCLSYLQMQKVRFGEMLHFSIVNPQLHDAKGKLPVYSLQLLAENAIKHNSFTNESPLTIFIDYNTITNVIIVKNKIQAKRMMEVTTKVGLKNLEERYRLLSNESITIVNDGYEFSVKIKILPPNQRGAEVII
ncbi:sensor histidine kinase [Ferruginibacter sp. SUN106]|uniref:sensor histidine kinase n=1 Tax=Ferruginibacter sp. SUN106 TaxID=2978348 RepID=UPI003D359D8E